MARFSPGLLSSIRDFGSSLTSPQVDATGAPASLGGMLARNVGGLLGRDMRTTAEKAQAELRAIDPRDPDAQLKGLEVIARYGTPAQIQAAFTKMQEIQTQRQDRQTEQTRIDRFRGSLIQRSKELGLGEARQNTILNADLAELKEIRKELLAEEQANVASLRGKAGKRAIAIQAGYRGQALEDVTNLDSDSFSGVMSGLETSEEALKIQAQEK